MKLQISKGAGLVLVLLSLHARGQVPDDLVWEPDIEYAVSGGLAAHLALDVIHPRSDKRLPAVVCIPGSDFRTADRKSCRALCIRLAQKGYVAVAVSYRLAPRYQFPAPVYDVKGAIRFLRGNAARFGIDPDRIGVTGSAAGAYLALFLGLTGGVPEFEGSGPFPEQSSRVACVVNHAGPVDLTKLAGKSILPAFLGGDVTQAPRNYSEASPIHWVTPSAAPVLTFQGANDWNVPDEQAVWLTDRMRAAGAEAELESIEGKDGDRADARMFAFFAKHLALTTERELLIADHGPGKEVLAVSWPSGKVLWRSPNMGGRDVQALPNGHVLYTMDTGQRVVEIGAQREVVWTYGAAQGLEVPVAAQRLPNGNTLIGDAKTGRLLEVDQAGKTVWSYQSEEIGNMRMRNCRRTPTGTTLVAIEAAGKVIEVDREGKVVWSYQPADPTGRSPYQAQRLANGNTLIGFAQPGEVVEVDPKGRVVRSIGGDGGSVRFGWVTGLDVLPNGGLLIADYTGGRIVELDSAGRIVHQLPTGPWQVASISLRQ